MDKLKALEYFVASVEEGSFAKAAKRLEISVPAVQKLVGALENSLGFALLERGARGVRLSASGGEYLDRCRALMMELDDLAQVERLLKGTGERPNGMLAVAAHPQLAHHILLPALPRFHALYPDIQIDFRTVNRIGDADAQTADVLLLHGWPEVPPEFVHRKLSGERIFVMASPLHLAEHGVPQHPTDLAERTCILMRNPAGILLDLWEFKRGAELLQVPVQGWMSTNAREAALDLVLGGHGLGRFSELTTRSHVQAGRLVLVLREWELQGGPPVNLIYKGTARRTPRLRAFIDFSLQCLSDLDVRGDGALAPISPERPAWHMRGYGRASATLRNKV